MYSQVLFGLKRQDIKSTSFKRPFIILKYLQLTGYQFFTNRLFVGILFERGFTCYLYHFYFVGTEFQVTFLSFYSLLDVLD